mmetsp:Transcript_80780/g.228826  ORF Transcript_80780/g.228826 Transcript_80780/m.228826 type:complete len:204 (+) Transcript_80780:331-942(+)
MRHKNHLSRQLIQQKKHHFQVLIPQVPLTTMPAQTTRQPMRVASLTNGPLRRRQKVRRRTSPTTMVGKAMPVASPTSSTPRRKVPPGSLPPTSALPPSTRRTQRPRRSLCREMRSNRLLLKMTWQLMLLQMTILARSRKLRGEMLLGSRAPKMVRRAMPVQTMTSPRGARAVQVLLMLHTLFLALLVHSGMRIGTPTTDKSLP